MKKNVLHLIPSFHQGGSERQALQLVRLLLEDGSYNIRLACLDKNGVLLDEAAKLGFDNVPEFPLASFYDLNMARQIRRFVKFLKENQIDIVQTHDFYSNIFGMIGAKLAGVPVRIAAKRETGMRTAKQLFVERRAFGFAHAVVVNSERVRAFLVDKGIPERKLNVIYNGIELKRFDLNGYNRTEYLKSLGLPDDKRLRFVTIVANLRDRVKNHEMFLHAAAQVAKKVDDVGFVVAGEGELLEETRNAAENLGLADQTFFIGRCSRVSELLALSDVCVLTSRSEGLSNSILEYMAAGKPVVATDVGGASEAVVDGETGYLVASDNVQGFANKISTLLNDPKRADRMGNEGKSRVSARFSTDAQLQNTLLLYKRELAHAEGKQA